MKGQRHDVERYYQRNTNRFVLFGGARRAHAIHRQLWGEGVTNADGAARHINGLLVRALRGITGERAPVFIDFGCGVGGTVLHLAAAFPEARVHGVTISRKQVDFATTICRDASLDSRAHFHLANFESLELDVQADAIVAVESFTHSQSADRFFAAVARHLEPGGRLIIVDDFAARTSTDMSAAEKRVADAFRSGWRVPGLCTIEECIVDAGRYGLEIEDRIDLTSLIRLHRPRDRLIGLIAPIASGVGLAIHPFFGNLIGGYALHRGLVSGLFEYRWLSFRRASRPHPGSHSG